MRKNEKSHILVYNSKRKKEYGGIENESNIIARYKRGWKKR